MMAYRRIQKMFANNLVELEGFSDCYAACGNQGIQQALGMASGELLKFADMNLVVMAGVEANLFSLVYREASQAANVTATRALMSRSTTFDNVAPKRVPEPCMFENTCSF